MTQWDFALASRRIGSGHPCLIIGEVAQAHDGSLGTAHALIDAIANAGADAVKFQTHLAAAESTFAEPWRVQFSRQDATRFDYWKRMEFTAPQWQGLKQHAEDRGLLFLSSPFSIEAVGLLERLGMAAWKVASGELENPLLLDRIAEAGGPVLLSSGMSSWSELDAAVARFRAWHRPVAVFQCTTAYPCPPEQIGLNLLAELRSRYACPVGLSDHSGTIFASLAAVTLGASLLEVHVTLSHEMFGPDVPASVTTRQLAELVRGVRFIERSLAAPIDKDAVAAGMEDLRRMFGKGAVAAADLPAGTQLALEHLEFKKPATGIPARDYETLLGRRLRRAVQADEPLTGDLLE